MTISEMLPTSDQLWLIDSQGERYTAELRMIARDLKSHGEPVPHCGAAGGR